MAWEVLVVRLAEAVGSSWSPEISARVPLGAAADVKRALQGVFGEGDWSSVDKGLFDYEGYSLEASIGICDEVDTMTLEFWKEGDPLSSLRELCGSNGWLAWDLDRSQPVEL